MQKNIEKKQDISVGEEEFESMAMSTLTLEKDSDHLTIEWFGLSAQNLYFLISLK